MTAPVPGEQSAPEDDCDCCECSTEPDGYLSPGSWAEWDRRQSKDERELEWDRTEEAWVVS